tara:strand:+ start:262 stop:600 length:339 start_codon:yes stop_codon:yes gene_type:complete
MLFLDIIDIALFSAYGLVIVGALLAVGFPIYLSSKNPASLKESAMAFAGLIIMFLVGYLISGNEVLPTYIEFGVDAGLSKFIGGMIILVYLLAGIAIGGIIYSEFSKTFKNG